MKFVRRLVYYLIGVGLGIIMVYFLFGDRDLQCSYFPNDRVLSDFRKKELRFAEQVNCLNTCWDLDSAFYASALRDSDIDFSFEYPETDTCRSYLLEMNWREKHHQLIVMNCDSAVIVTGIQSPARAESCNCP